MLLGIIYATSLGVWYFSSIEESKIVTTTLTALYIGVYLRLRERWTLRGALLLMAILLAACLNEIVAVFLVVIPAVDTLVQRGLNFRQLRWIALHGLAGPAALVFLEGVVNGILVPPGTLPEGASHFSMLRYYVLGNNFGAAEAHSLLVNWLFFSIAAPTPDTIYALPPWPTYRAYFEPVLANYLSSPLSAGLAVLLGLMVVASVPPRFRVEAAGHLAGILPALFAYTVLRGTFFFILNPLEGLLYSGPAILAHLLLLGIPFAVSRIPAKQWLLAAFAVLLLVTNGTFIVGACGLLLKGCP